MHLKYVDVHGHVYHILIAKYETRTLRRTSVAKRTLPSSGMTNGLTDDKG